MREHSTRIGQGHRVTIPAGAFHQAALRDGAEVVVRAQGPGRIVIECADFSEDTTDLAIGGAYGMNGFEGSGMPDRR
jgi:antitoxin component of MazEF toxin-antitoxin module